MTKLKVLILICAIVLPDLLEGITTIHHDKPESSRIAKMVTKMTAQVPFPERHKRLLPYINYYISTNQRKEKFTPFVESNALPGPFIPIIQNQKKPNYLEIYETLAQLKQAQQTMRQKQIYRKPFNYQPVQFYEHYKPSNTFIETYTPTNIDLEIEERKKYETTKPQVVNYVIDKPIPYQVRKPVIILRNEKPRYEIEAPKQKFYIQEHVTQKPTYLEEYIATPSPETSNFLAKILKQLQNQNTLPQTFTPQNIDNSIRTLVKILNGLQKEQGLKAKPIVVLDESQEEPEEEEKTSLEKPYTQTFPANTIEGGTPGRPGIDYPALSTIPQTDFNCKKQRYKGFFGDPHTNCQVWHYCDLNGGQASFLCPNGTIFSQVALTCDWWYNVKCSNTPQLYVLNERLYKYIIPLAPKFPEDYNGPLVDRYLALKFQEMEEKMKKEKKDEKEEEEEKDDSDQLQDIINERAKMEES